MGKRVLKGFIIMAMIISVLTNSEKLEAKNNWTEYERITYDKKGNPVYSKITFGKWKGKPIQWRILNINNKTGTALLFADSMLDARVFEDKKEEATWETSSIRKWLNEDFYEKAFNEKEKKLVKMSRLENDINLQSGLPDNRETKDRVFLLSEKEITNVKYGFSGLRKRDDPDEISWKWIYDVDKGRKVKGGTRKLGYWLRTSYDKKNVLVAASTGLIAWVGGFNINRMSGIVPAIRVNISKINRKQIKLAPRQIKDYNRPQRLWTNRDVMVIEEGQTEEVGVKTNAALQVGILPNQIENQKITVSSKNPKVASIRKLTDKLYEITGKKVGKTTIEIITVRKNKKGNSLKKEVTVSVGKKSTLKRKEIQDIKRDEKGNPIYSKIEYGTWEGKPLKWRVMKVDEEQERALLLTDRVLDFDMGNIPELYMASWDYSRIKDWLNAKGAFQGFHQCSFYDEVFTEKEKEHILLVNGNSREKDDGTENWKERIESRIFIPTLEQATNEVYGFNGEYMNGNPPKYRADMERAGKTLRGEKKGWWVLTNDEEAIEEKVVIRYYVNELGEIEFLEKYPPDLELGLRVMLYLDLSYLK